jgi:hypothetical protein
MNIKINSVTPMCEKARLFQRAVLEGAASVRLDFGCGVKSFPERRQAWNERIALRQALTGRSALQCLDDEVAQRRLGQWGFFVLALAWLALVVLSVHWQAPEWVSGTLALAYGVLLVAPSLLLRHVLKQAPTLVRTPPRP